MFQSLDLFRTSMAMARHAGQSQALTAQNMANADTPGYRAREMPDFAAALRDASGGQRATRAGHMNGAHGMREEPVLRRAATDPNGNTVSLEAEMIAAVNADRQHSRALAIYRSGLTILRASLGRN